MRATYIGCVGTQAHGRQVMLKWRHHVKLHFSVFRDFWKLILKLILKLKKQWWARKRIHYLCEGRIEKSVPQDHHVSSLSKPCDAKRWTSGQNFLSYPHTHDRFLYSQLSLTQLCITQYYHLSRPDGPVPDFSPIYYCNSTTFISTTAKSIKLITRY